jgi:hypothetical protein
LTTTVFVLSGQKVLSFGGMTQRAFTYSRVPNAWSAKLLANSFSCTDIMERDKFDSKLRSLKAAIPFCRFSVKMVNGDQIDVDCADALAVRDGIAFFLKPSGVPVWIEHECVTHLTQ